jgi:hypothetical protein
MPGKKDGGEKREPGAERKTCDHVAWIMRTDDHPRKSEPKAHDQKEKAIGRGDQSHRHHERTDRRRMAGRKAFETGAAGKSLET